MATTDIDLALRDPALAALVGAVPGNGTNFGYEENMDEFGYDGDFGAEAAQAQLQASAQATQAYRTGILNPNQGLGHKVERYIFPLASTTAAPTWGIASSYTFSDQPKVRFRPQRFTVNVPCEGVAYLSQIEVSNVTVSVGNGIVDCAMFGPRAVGLSLDLPTIDPSQRVNVNGNWTAFVPAGYVPGVAFALTAAFTGPATMAGK